MRIMSTSDSSSFAAAGSNAFEPVKDGQRRCPDAHVTPVALPCVRSIWLLQPVFSPRVPTPLRRLCLLQETNYRIIYFHKRLACDTADHPF